MSQIALCFLILINSVFAKENSIQNEDEGASFGIVFDTTGSMESELRQVKAHALSILNKALEREGQPIQDFVFAPFNDPDVPEAQVTTNPDEFKGYLESITVDGGGDGPELTYTGLLNALKLVRPRARGDLTSLGENGTQNANIKVSSNSKKRRSTIFVFTDDLAKDRHHLPEVLQLIQKKQVLVVFVISSNDVEPTFQNVTAISSGQIFQLEKADVSEIMKIIDNTLQAEVVNMVSVTKTGASVDKYPVVVDKTIDEFTASISGNGAKITVTDPEGQIVTDKSKVVPLIDLENAKVIKVNKPEPGVWNVTSSSTSDHSFRLTGVSKLDFISGFSAHKAVSLQNTFQLPLRGVTNHLTITSSNIDAVRNIDHVEITALDGTVLVNLTVYPISGHAGFYRNDAFLPPEKAFYVTVVAKGIDGQIIKRTSRTGVVPAPPVREMLTIKDEENSGRILRHQPMLWIVSSAVLLGKLTLN